MTTKTTVLDLNAERCRRKDEAHRNYLRRRIDVLEVQQRDRVALTEQQKTDMDRVIALKDAEIANLRATLESACCL